jgi:uncharacterized membrane protein (UPF0127 family)
MTRRHWLLAAAAGALLAMSTLLFESIARADAGTCAVMTPELNTMTERDLVFENDDGRRVTITARVAQSGAQISAGFQRVCPETIRNTAILFVFPFEVRTRFHMRNVYGALDIAFIGADGAVRDIVRMEPYGSEPGAAHPVYGTDNAFQYALEAAPGAFDSRGIAPGESRLLLP